MRTFQDLKQMCQAKGHEFWPENDPYNLFIYGIRHGYNYVNEWDDILGVAFQDEYCNQVVIEHRGTTKPGLYYLKNKMGNVNGTAILQPGQYIDVWQIGRHGLGKPWEHDALRQIGDFKVWRDSDADGKFDIDGKTYTDVQWLNAHTTFRDNPTTVHASSAGCQVRQNDLDHITFMALCNRAAEVHGDKFSYTLFEDIV